FVFMAIILLSLESGHHPSKAHLRNPVMQDSDPDVERTLKLLWSSDIKQRQEAKVMLVQFGLRAEKPLVLLLDDLIKHPYRRSLANQEKSYDKPDKNVGLG